MHSVVRCAIAVVLVGCSAAEPTAGDGQAGAGAGAVAGASGSSAGGAAGTMSAPTAAGSSGVGGAGAGSAAVGGQGGSISGGGGTASNPGGAPSAGSAGSAGQAAVPACETNEVARCSGTSPIRCDFGGGAGDFMVTLELGGASASTTYVEAEAHRRVLGSAELAAGETKRFAFGVNVRQPEGQPIQDVPAGTPGLQLYLSGD